MAKSILPSSFTHVATAFSRLSMLLTSTAPMPMTLLPDRAVAMSLAIPSVFSTFRPTMQAFAPRWTRARTCAEQILPFPPVQKTTLSLKMPSLKMLDRYSDLSSGMVRGVPVQVGERRVLLKVRDEEGTIWAEGLERAGSKLDATARRSDGLCLKKPRTRSVDCGRMYAIDVQRRRRQGGTE